MIPHEMREWHILNIKLCGYHFLFGKGGVTNNCVVYTAENLEVL